MPPDDPQDLRSVLSQVVTEAETAAAETPPPVERPAAREPLATDAPRVEDRPRGADGKFVPKAGDGETLPPEPDDPLPDATGETPPPPVTDPPVEVPQHWSAAERDMIAGLPKEQAAKVVERFNARVTALEAGFTPKLQEAAEIKRQYQGAMEIFQPHVEGLRQRGHTPSDVIKAWAGIEQDMLQGREMAARGGVNAKGAEHVARMIQAYSIDPGAVASLLRGEALPQPNGVGAAAGSAAIPPQYVQELYSIRQELNARTAAETAARQASSTAQVEAFAAEKDASGALKHPYFSELERDMAAFAQIEISQGKVPSIADLYDRALYANRETRSKALAASSAEAQRKAASERKAKAEAATRASSSVAGAPGSGGTPGEGQRRPKTLREEIAEAASEAEAAGIG